MKTCKNRRECAKMNENVIKRTKTFKNGQKQVKNCKTGRKRVKKGAKTCETDENMR